MPSHLNGCHQIPATLQGGSWHRSSSSWSSSMRLNADTAPVRQTPRLTARPCYNECSPACLVTETLPPLGSSDHLCVFCELDLSVHQKVNNSTTRRRIWRYDRVDFKDLNSILVNADWDQALQTEDVNDASRCGRPNSSELSHSVFHQKSSKKIKPKNPYVTPEIETAIEAKGSALMKMRKDTTTETQDKFKQLRNRVTHLLRKSERAHATKLFRQARLQPSETASKSFWQHMKEVQGSSKQTVIPKLISNDITATTDLEKADVLNGFFSSQTILPNCGTSFPDKLSLPQNTRSFNTLHTTPKGVFDILSHLKEGNWKLLGLTTSPLTCFGSVQRELQKVSLLFSTKVSLLQHFWLNGKWHSWFQYSRRAISATPATIDLFHYCRCSVRS